MLNKNVIDEINAKVSEIMQNSPAKDIEKNMRVLLSGAFTRLDLVTRDEFVGALQVVHFLILLDGNKPARIARADQFIRPRTVMDLANGLPIFLFITSIRDHFSSRFL